MANWAYNNLNISGNKEHMQAVYKLLEEYEKDSTRGHSPLEKTNLKWDNGYLFNIDFHQEKLNPEDTEFSVSIESKYDEPEDTLKHLTKLFDISILNSVQELGGGLYGETVYNGGNKVLEILLDQSEILEYDEDKDGYTHPETGEIMESEYDYYDELIERKKAIIKQFI